jgi:hypothetical protein
MKRFLFAVALAALFASAGTAEEKAAPVTTTAAPVVITSGTPIVETTPAQSTRRGLFGRLRNRNNSTATYSTTPVMTAPVNATTQPPISTPAPMPMPGTKTTTGAVVMPQPGEVVQASGSLPAGTYTTTDGTIIQIGGTQMEAQPTTDTQSGRRGLFGRLRSR